TSDRGFRVGRIGKMRRVMNASPLLLCHDLALEIGGHTLEIRDHRLDLRDLATFFVKLKFLQADECVTRLHGPLLPGRNDWFGAAHGLAELEITITPDFLSS